MAPRANWKGFLRLSLVTCPIALFPATSESEKISFNQINRKTGHRIKYQKVDADTGEEVSNDDIIKGYKVDTDRYLEVSKDELDNIALESTRTIDIDEFVPRSKRCRSLPEFSQNPPLNNCAWKALSERFVPGRNERILGQRHLCGALAA
jgi:hypothetical protein